MICPNLQAELFVRTATQTIFLPVRYAGDVLASFPLVETRQGNRKHPQQPNHPNLSLRHHLWDNTHPVSLQLVLEDLS
ncbi:MAG: hypothetical protein QME62_03730 [Armatimonadota bacterium]|nr:hypothetical protein [Armatimonadota bacterium]